MLPFCTCGQSGLCCSSMLAVYHACLTFGTSQRTDCSLTFEEGVLKINKFFLFALLQDTTKQISEQAHVCSPEVQGSNFGLCLAASLRILNCTTSQSLQTRLSLTFLSLTNSLFVSNKLESSLACLLLKPCTVSQTIPFTVWELRVLLELFPVVGFHAATLFLIVREFTGTENSGHSCGLLDANWH